MKYFIHILRLLIGMLFIFSGMIKGVDPIGTAIKMEEYFSVFSEYLPALDWLWDLMINLSLPFSLFMIIFEVVLGIALLLGLWFVPTMWSLIIMLVFFTILTGFTLITGKVTDCGCFGDFLKLKPIETFMKDIILVVMILIVWIFRKHLDIFKKKEIGIFAIIAGIIFLAFVLYTSYSVQTKIIVFIICTMVAFGYAMLHSKFAFPQLFKYGKFAFLSIVAIWFCSRNVTNLPMFNFRAYTIGTDLKDCTSEEGLDPGEANKMYTLKNKVSGEEIMASDNDYLEKKLWEEYDVVKGKTTEIIIREPEEPKCKDFKVYNVDGENIEEEMIHHQGYSFIVASYDISSSSKQGHMKVANFLSQLKNNTIRIDGITASNIEEANELVNGVFEFNNLDEVPIKTMIRANPGIVMLKDGVVVERWHHNHLPDVSTIKSKYAL